MKFETKRKPYHADNHTYTATGHRAKSFERLEDARAYLAKNGGGAITYSTEGMRMRLAYYDNGECMPSERCVVEVVSPDGTTEVEAKTLLVHRIVRQASPRQRRNPQLDIFEAVNDAIAALTIDEVTVVAGERDRISDMLIDIEREAAVELIGKDPF